MPEFIWTYAKMTPEQVQALKEAETTLGAGLLLAFQRNKVDVSGLTESQIECLEGLERQLGVVILAVKQPES